MPQISGKIRPPLKEKRKLKPKAAKVKAFTPQDLEVCIVADDSGSMSSLKEGILGCIDSTISFVKEHAPNARFTYVPYDWDLYQAMRRVNPVIHREPIETVYGVRYHPHFPNDRLGDGVIKALKILGEAPKTSRFLFLLITDGGTGGDMIEMERMVGLFRQTRNITFCIIPVNGSDSNWEKSHRCGWLWEIFGKCVGLNLASARRRIVRFLNRELLAYRTLAA